MTIDYSRHDKRRHVRVTVDGLFDENEWKVGVTERLHREGVEHYAILYDLRAMTTTVTIADVKSFVAKGMPVPSPDRGPIAIVARDNLYANACAFAAMATGHLTVSIFRDLEDADRWLRQQVKRRAAEPSAT
jgi:hypothetical protein